MNSQPNPTATPVALPGEHGTATQVATGAGHSLVVTSTGRAYSFGDNTKGELGRSGLFSINSTPFPVTLPGQVGDVTQAAAGLSHSLVVTSTRVRRTNGQLYAFGENYDGELGIATNSGTATPNPTPTLVTLPGQNGAVNQIAAGAFHSLVTTSTGQLYAFGGNHEGELGIAANSTPNPTPRLVTLPGQNGAVTQVAAGGIHSLVVTSSGQLYTFGSNGEGQLGRPTLNNTKDSTPTLVTLPGQNGAVTEVAAGAYHSLAVTSSGQLYAFGRNTYGQLGSATNNGTTTANPTATLVRLPGRNGTVAQIGAGENHSLAVTSTGQLYAFGRSDDGSLGRAANESTTSEANPTPRLAVLEPGTTIDKVATGAAADHTLAIVSDLAVTSSGLPHGTVGSPYSATLTAAGGGSPLSWSVAGLPGGLALAASTGAISGLPTAIGSFPVTVTVRDTYGIQASKTLTLAVAGDAPRLSRVSQSHRTWREHRTRRHRHGAPIGTRFSFTLDEPAHIALTFNRRAAGRMVGRRCVAPTHRNRRNHRCMRALTNGRLQLDAHAGVNKISFKGRLSRTATLPPGHYALLIVARTGGNTSRTHTLSFTITAP